MSDKKKQTKRNIKIQRKLKQLNIDSKELKDQSHVK